MKTQNRDSKGRFASNQTSTQEVSNGDQKVNLADINVGDIVSPPVIFLGFHGEPFEDYKDSKFYSSYILVTNKDYTDFFFINPAEKKVAKYGISMDYFKKYVKNNIWTVVSQEKVNSLFLGTEMPIPETWDDVLVYSVISSFIYAVLENEDNVAPVVEKEEEKPVEQKTITPLNLDDIKNGALYFNLGECEVQRVVEVVGNLIYSSWHKGAATPYGRSSFRLATKEEVNKYLDEAKELTRED